MWLIIAPKEVRGTSMDSLLKQQAESQQWLSSSSCAHTDKNGEGTKYVII